MNYAGNASFIYFKNIFILRALKLCSLSTLQNILASAYI